ncbi:MAG: CGNR zinc finger domain-containing protein [Mycobacteriales bacterium]
MKDVTSVFDLDTAANRALAVVNTLRWESGPASAAALAAEVFQEYGEADPTVTESDGAALLAAADALREVFAAGDDPDTAARLLNALLARYAGPPRLTAHGGAPWHLHVDSDDDAPWAEWLLASGALALAALLAAAGGDRPAFGVCGAADCRMCYLDSGRGGGRRYCSSRCATRTRVAAFRGRS